jgi:hypothetical protein
MNPLVQFAEYDDDETFIVVVVGDFDDFFEVVDCK